MKKTIEFMLTEEQAAELYSWLDARLDEMISLGGCPQCKAAGKPLCVYRIKADYKRHNR